MLRVPLRPFTLYPGSLAPSLLLTGLLLLVPYLYLLQEVLSYLSQFTGMTLTLILGESFRSTQSLLRSTTTQPAPGLSSSHTRRICGTWLCPAISLFMSTGWAFISLAANANSRNTPTQYPAHAGQVRRLVSSLPCRVPITSGLSLTGLPTRLRLRYGPGRQARLRIQLRQ